MKIIEETLHDLNLAFNESKILDCTILEDEREVITVFDQFALLKDGTAPKDRGIKIIFENVSRITAQLKLGEWNDRKAIIKRLSIETLSEEIRQFKGEEMYGWEFINIPKSDKDFHKWEKSASLDINFQPQSNFVNTIDIFSEHFSENSKTLNLRIWFEKFRIESMFGDLIDEIEFIERGQRAWNKVFNGTHILPDKAKSEIERVKKSNVLNRLKNVFNRKTT